MRTLRALAGVVPAAVLVLAGLIVAAPPVLAGGGADCASSAALGSSGSGTVSPNALDEWWYYDHTGPVTYTVDSAYGEVDLYVTGGDCTTTLCADVTPTNAPTSCTANQNGRAYVRIRFAAAYGQRPDNSVDYVLTRADGSTYPSDDCTATPLVQGITMNTYVRVVTQRVDASTTWVCVRVEGRIDGYPFFGGKFVVSTAATPPVPTTDGNATACTTAGGNTVPGPHPLLGGHLGDPGDPATYLPFLLDSWAGDTAAWVCVGIATVNVRVKVPTAPDGEAPNVVFEQDATAGHVFEQPAPTVPSGRCQAAGRTAIQWYDYTAAGARTYLYSWMSSPTALQVCAGVTGPVAAGGVLTVDTAGLGGVPSVTTGTDAAGCPVSVVGITNPAVVDVRRSATGAAPASVCVTAGGTTVRVTVSAGSGGLPASVTWTPDPGTP
jgi:hypothetical protein